MIKNYDTQKQAYLNMSEFISYYSNSKTCLWALTYFQAFPIYIKNQNKFQLPNYLFSAL